MMPLLDLPANGCKFGVDTLGDGTHLFCAEPRDGDRPYCPAHCAIAYRPSAAPVAKSVAALVTIDSRPYARAVFRTDIMSAVSEGVGYRA